MKSSPTWIVPFSMSTVATGPFPGSSCASTTTPLARRFGFARRSRISACSRICSSSSGTPVPFFAEIARVERRAAELLEHDAVLQQLLLHLRHVRRRQIDLVDRDHHRHAGVLGVRDRLDRLRHHLVIRGDHEHDDVRHLRTARAHGRECLVARRVEEGDRLAVRERDVVRTDVLRDAAGLAGNHVRLADVIEQRRLAMVDVTHDRDDRRTRDEILAPDRRLRRRESATA